MFKSKATFVVGLAAFLLVGCGPSAEDLQREKARKELDEALRGVHDAAANVGLAMEGLANPASPPPAVTSDYIKASARQLCSAQYPTDFAMQGGCKRNIESGAGSIAELQERYRDVPDMQAALAECVAQYTENGATDFALAGGCARNNESGLQEMAR